MRLTIILSTLVLLFALVFLTNPVPAYACSCIPSLPVKEELKSVQSVFSGEVLSIETDPSPDYKPNKVTFKVSEIWKGENKSEITIYTARDSEACGFEFMQGVSYLVYATENGGKLRTGICSLTKDLSQASADLVVLGEGKQPLSDSVEVNNQTQSPYATWIILTAVFLVGLLFILFVVKRKA
ncbi:hypothetical protein [Bacillus pinisoli]|uniref:hypothetical protein n=1 Tax=Bacillus pinisoli TaxID=2901866 RepID=UPI001FF4BF82|nr:hypothetical protein [Bacillus pinisoli]